MKRKYPFALFLSLLTASIIFPRELPKLFSATLFTCRMELYCNMGHVSAPAIFGYLRPLYLFKPIK